jgi:hypothetical protein
MSIFKSKNKKRIEGKWDDRTATALYYLNKDAIDKVIEAYKGTGATIEAKRLNKVVGDEYQQALFNEVALNKVKEKISEVLTDLVVESAELGFLDSQSRKSILSEYQNSYPPGMFTTKTVTITKDGKAVDDFAAKDLKKELDKDLKDLESFMHT